MKTRNYFFFLSILTISFSCTKAVIGDIFDNDLQINLKWFPAYQEDTFEKNKIALEWCFAFLGSDITNQSSSSYYFKEKDKTITINIDELGFSDTAIEEFKILHKTIKNSEEYRFHNAFDIGKYIALTIGSSYHYYKIAEIPDNIDYYTSLYLINNLKGYINNSSISLPTKHRILSYSRLTNGNQLFVTTEIDPTTQEIKEFETVERMPNGLTKFGIYDPTGHLISNANKTVSNAGKPAKCMWCHESNIQVLFRNQNDFQGFLTANQLNDTLNYYSNQLKNYQNNVWLNPSQLEKQLHTNMELSYISYMEPSAERLSLEWQTPINQVKNLLSNISTHTHDEFSFLGELYHRKDVEIFSPYKTIRPPSNIREQSEYEPNLLNR